jgi:toxin ParE1/3/4
LRVKGFKRRVSIAFSVDAESGMVVIHGVFYGGQDFETLLGDTTNDA